MNKHDGNTDLKKTGMQHSLREDYLEALCLFAEKNGRYPDSEELAATLSRPIDEVPVVLADLAISGEVIYSPGGLIELTPLGKLTGERVVKKHATLQCFLSEILGMDREKASSEACTLEHTVSDETIDRLGNYLKQPGYNQPGRHRFGQPCTGTQFSLLDFNEGDEVIVCGIIGRGSAKRLLDLGVVPGQRVKIRRKLGSRSIVIEVKGCDVALSPEIAAAISVERGP
jgi:DtxR family Mn-dependent transcriptional regulator